MYDIICYMCTYSLHIERQGDEWSFNFELANACCTCTCMCGVLYIFCWYIIESYSRAKSLTCFISVPIIVVRCIDVLERLLNITDMKVSLTIVSLTGEKSTLELVM